MYEDADIQAMQQDIEDCCIVFGSNFLSGIVVLTEGLYFWTADGRKVLDWTSGQMSCLLGHGHPEIVEAIQEHAKNLDHLYSGMMSPPVISLAKTLTGLLPRGLDKAMFLSTGGEANECAIKLTKTYTGKFEIVGLSASWHGSSSGAQGVQYNAGKKGAGPLMRGMHILPAPDAYRSVFRRPDGSHDWKTELKYGWSMVDRSSCGSLAAVILEPIMSSGGMITLPEGYLAEMKGHCESRGMLMIVDEAQTAFGRCGDLFGIQHASNQGVVPDLLTLSKTLGNGIALSAVLTSHTIADDAKAKGFLFYTTHGNDPLPAAVGSTVVSIVTKNHNELVLHARKMGDLLYAGLQRLKEQFACIGEVRGRGLMAGIEIVADRRRSNAPDLNLGKKLSAKMLGLGLSATIAARNAFTGCLRIAPPITSTAEDIGNGLAIIKRAFETVEGTAPLIEGK